MSTSMPAADPTVRLRLATQLHFALLRHCGIPVGVRTLPMGGDEAHGALNGNPNRNRNRNRNPIHHRSNQRAAARPGSG